MAAIEPGKIRNVAVVGHRGTGKTSLVEALLYRTNRATATKRLNPRQVRIVALDKPSELVVSAKSPLLIDRYLSDATEVEMSMLRRCSMIALALPSRSEATTNLPSCTTPLS